MLTKDKAVKWARKAFEMDWKPKGVAEVNSSKKEAKTSKPVVTVASYLVDSDEEDDAVEYVEGVEEKDEFTRYLEVPDVPRDSDLLAWWKVHSKDFPNVGRMARQFLAVPATTAGVERAFSKVGAMHSDLRKGLTEGTIEHSMMACLNTVEF
ncbi:hypothetical protein CYMTET_4720 [Cymbomonas tetramitiformis]|uniref:HAT C-terminal dimerisation domain-containing protein n=1 Tax=Cymbomonas tetramitiformis TaxID=36881 RepID=A0AAE0H2G9_9CHLO|nr:hypothetical protein CYMTET_4720 [Cymbomonas tetramitiformis]